MTKMKVATLFAVAVTLGVPGVLARPAAGAQGTCGQQQAANYGGAVLVLDTNSMSYSRGKEPQVSTPSACCEACGKANYCNVWSFCIAAEGCGAPGSCSGYVSTHPKLTTSTDEIKTPVEAFGPYAAGGGCTSDGRWMQYTCSLKRTDDPSKVVSYGGADAAGWVSGTAPKPSLPGCPAGLAKDTCAAGLATKNPMAFFDCIAKPQIYGRGPGPCAACANLTDAAVRDTCLGCLAEFSPSKACGSCLFWDTTGGRVDEDRTTKCFACVNAGAPDNRASTACSSCFMAPSASGHIDTAGCLACASDKKRPAPGRSGCANCHDKSTSARAGCLACADGASTAERAGVCGSCSYAGMKDVTGRCYECLKTVGQGAAMYCAYLGQSNNSPIPPATLALAPQYYGCVAGAGGRGGDCTDCLRQGPNAKACLSCPLAVKSASASWCASCWREGAPTEASQQCQTCLSGHSDSNAAYQQCVAKMQQGR